MQQTVEGQERVPSATARTIFDLAYVHVSQASATMFLETVCQTSSIGGCNSNHPPALTLLLQRALAKLHVYNN